MITPVLLCGGSGTRLWPLSRKSYPKQFSKLMGQDSLFQGSAKRLAGTGYTPPLVVTANDFRFIVTEQLAEADIAPGAVLIEPVGRDTAPAILAAALHLAILDPEAVMLVAPSDHVIPDTVQFNETVALALSAAKSGKLVTFGITPDRPETGYGYLKVENLSHAATKVAPLPLGEFVEKPDAETAAAMLADGRYLWNAGIFLFSANAIIKAFMIHAPDMVLAVQAALDIAKEDLGFIRLDPTAWERADSISIDYAIMEKAGNLSVMPFKGRWSDLGDWGAVWRETQENSVSLFGQATAIDCKNTMLRSEVEGQEIVGIGLDDIVAVAMPDAVLVTHKGRTQEVKQAVTALKAKKALQAETFPKDHRPWGWFETLVMGERFHVKRIVVHPGAALSLQSHHHRSEHWIVVEGTARVTIDDVITLVTENQSVYIPLGAIHRLENPGKVSMALIEVQTGMYFGEDDIIRYEDPYKRS